MAPTAPVSPRAVHAATHDVSHGIFPPEVREAKRHTPRENPKSFSTLFSAVGNEAHPIAIGGACNVSRFLFLRKARESVGFDTARNFKEENEMQWKENCGDRGGGAQEQESMDSWYNGIA
jgi:hypothetical protein